MAAPRATGNLRRHRATPLTKRAQDHDVFHQMWRAAVPANERVRPVAELGRGGLRFPQTGAARRAVLRVVEEEANDVHIFSGRETIRIPRRPSYGVGPVPIEHANAAIEEPFRQSKASNARGGCALEWTWYDARGYV